MEEAIKYRQKTPEFDNLYEVKENRIGRQKNLF